MREGMTAGDFNRFHPVGTPVTAYPGSRGDEPLITRTRTPAWTRWNGQHAVAVEGALGGFRLAHIDIRTPAAEPPATD